MSQRPFRRWLTTLSLASLCLAAATHAEERSWTDSTGKYKIEAEFVEVADGKVRLRRADGKTLALPLEKLSPADRAYVEGRQAAADNPFEAGLENTPAEKKASPLPAAKKRPRRRGPDDVFQPGDRVEVHQGVDWKLGVVVEYNRGDPFIGVRIDGDSHDSNLPADNFFVRWAPDDAPAATYDPTQPAPGTDAVPHYPVKPANLSSVRMIAPATKCRVTPDGASAGDAGSPGIVALPPPVSFFERPVALDLASPQARLAVVGLTGGAEPGDDSSRVVVVDAARGRIVATHAVSSGLKLLAISPSGKRLATIGQVSGLETRPLEIWDLSESELKHVASWRMSSQPGIGVLWLGWADEQHVLVVGFDGLTALDASSGRGVYRIPCEGASFAAFSPGRKQIAVAGTTAALVHDARSGAALGRLKLDEDHGDRRVAFSPNGRYLAVTATSRVAMYDLPSGNVIDEVYCQSGSRFQGDVAWLSDEHVLVGGADLVHIPSRVVVWTYSHMAELLGHLGTRPWYLFNDHGAAEGRTLCSFDLSPEVASAIKESDLALPPGSDVSFEVESIVDLQADAAGHPFDAGKTVRELIEKAGFRIVDDAPARFVARALLGETKQTTYKSFHAFDRESSTVSVTQRVYEIELLVDGKSVWRRRTVQDAPQHIMMERDETIEQAVARVMAPNPGYFGTGIPSRILPDELARSRTSTLTAGGIQ
jgi:WD40 repeat protein